MTQSYARPGAILNLAVLEAACSGVSTALTAGTGKANFPVPHAMTAVLVRAHLAVAQTSGSIFTVDINQNGQSILSTKLTIDNGETTSVTAATSAVIIVPDLVDDATITVDVDQIGDGTAAGLTIEIIGAWQFGAVDTLNDGIVAFWALGETSGSNATDSVGSNTLTQHNTVGQAAGIGGVGNSRSFNGTNQYLSHAFNSTLEFQDADWTFVVWVYTTDNTLLQRAMSQDTNTGTDGVNLSLLGSTTQYMNLRAYESGNSKDVAASSFGVLSNNTWYMVACWHDSTNLNINISVNAGTVNTTSLGAALSPSTSAEFDLGVFNAGGASFWKGRLQYSGKWSRILTQTELTQLYNSGSGKAYPFS